VSRNGNGFHLTLEDRERMHARRVVVAAGISDFASRPEPFRDMPTELVSHASQEDDLRRFADRDVIVVGGGQSALESAAILGEAGARVEVLAREADVHFLVRRWHHKLGPVSRLLYAPPDVGPMGISWCVAIPRLFTSMPRRTQTWMSRRALRPAGAGWLSPRLGGVRITTGISVADCTERGGRVALTLSDGSVREVDHVLLGTGYRVDISRYPFLGRELVAGVEQVNGYPRLRRGFESSVPGLHFMGAPAAYSYGPLMRFVAGSPYAGKELIRGLKRRLRPATAG
jgi:FAD-dependent urate hydroxylase